MSKSLFRSKLARDLESLALRFDTATQPGKAPHPWTPAAIIVATVLSRLVAMLAAWGTPAGQLAALRIADAFGPIVVNVSRLAEIAARWLPGPRALELARNVAGALADGVEPVEETIREMVAHRRRELGLAIGDETASELVAALTEAATERRSEEEADLDALGRAIDAIRRATADAASIHERMRASAGRPG